MNTTSDSQSQQTIGAVGAAVAVLAFELAALVEGASGRLTPFDRSSYVAMMVLMVPFLFAFARRGLPFSWIQRLRAGVYLLAVGFFVSKLGYLLYALPEGFDVLSEASEFIPWVPALFALGFLAHSARTGFRLGVALSAGLIGTSLPFIIGEVVGGVDRTALLNMVVQNHLAHTVVLFLLFAFARTAQLYTAAQERARAMHQLAHTDLLTGLHNRRHLENRLLDELRRSGRYLRPLSVIMLDIDHFKDINDRYGHQVGDEVLREVGRVLMSGLRGQDLAARWGGEEFCLVLPETDLQTGFASAERIRQRLEHSELLKDEHIAASIGIAEYNLGESVNTLIERADRALYQAKLAGRNRSQVASRSLGAFPTAPAQPS